MKKIFDENITEEGIHAINALAECNRELLVNIIKEEGDESSEADTHRLTLGSILFLSGALSEAENHAKKYLDSSEKKFNERSEEVVSGILLLANIYSQSGKVEECRLIQERIGVSLRQA